MLTGKRFRKKLVSIAVTATLVLSAFNIAVSPNVVHADPVSATAPVLVSTVISEGNQSVTLTFDQPLGPPATPISTPFLIKRSGSGSFTASDLDLEQSSFSEDQLSIKLHYNSPLVGTDNQIRIQAGAFANATDPSLINTEITTDNLVLGDVTPPRYLGNEVSADKTKVIVKFNEPLLDNHEDLLTEIRLNCECVSEPLAFADQDPLVISGNTVVITLSAPLTAEAPNDSFHLYLQEVRDASGNEYENGYYVSDNIYPDAPKIDNVSSGYEGIDYIQLGFNQVLFSNNSDAAALKAAITLSKDGGDYLPLGDGDTVSQSQQSIFIILSRPAPGTYNVKIAADTFKNYSGVVLPETNTEAITEEEPITITDHAEPVLVDATVANDVVTTDGEDGPVDDDVTIVTLNFNESIADNTLYENEDDQTVSNLKSYIRLARNNDYWGYYPLGGLDTAAIDPLDPTKLVITLHDPLVGNQNKIMVLGGALIDSDHNAMPDIITHSLTAPVADIAPQLQSSDINNKNHDVIFVFDENIQAVNAATLKANVQIVSGYAFEPIETQFGPLGNNDTVTISGNKLIVRFASALTDEDNYVRIGAETLKDSSNNQIVEAITGTFHPKDLIGPQLTDASFYDAWTVSPIYNLELNFDQDITDATIDEQGVSHLTDKISYSIDQGNTFLPLGAEDSATIQTGCPYNYILVMIHAPLSGQVIFKLDAGAVEDDNGNELDSPVMIDAVLAQPLRTTSNLFSDVPSELKFVDNPDWVKHIQKIEVTQQIGTLPDWNTRYPKVTLTDEDYSIASGKITIKQGIFENDSSYKITIHAIGYEDVYYETSAHVSTESYYVTPTLIEKSNGLTAKLSLGDNYGSDGATILFQLKKDGSPVSIVALSASYLDDGIYTANFNVSDPNYPGYSVQAFVVSEFSTDPEHVGINLSSEMSQADFDLWAWNHNPA